MFGVIVLSGNTLERFFVYYFSLCSLSLPLFLSVAQSNQESKVNENFWRWFAVVCELILGDRLQLAHCHNLDIGYKIYSLKVASIERMNVSWCDTYTIHKHSDIIIQFLCVCKIAFIWYSLGRTQRNAEYAIIGYRMDWRKRICLYFYQFCLSNLI